MTRIAGYTPLDRLPLSEVQRRELASLWIESVEELVALQAAMARRASASVSSGLMTSATQLARDVLPPETYGRMSSPVQPGALGYVIDEKRRIEFEQVVSAGYQSSPPTDLLRSSLPSAVRLMDQMPPVRNQHDRGTCVAFGVLALREFLIGASEDLSEQFLYWACKKMDGVPHLSGTYVSTGMAALSEAGVCREATWPYNPFPDGDTEGQGPPPYGARDEAKRFVLRSHRGVSQRSVAHYKSVLAGGDGVRGMPIVIGTPVFKSWYESFVFAETGKINMPLPGDEIISGHCWCIVGYVDDEDSVGGGYFIVRNSWGTDDFARLSPEAPGHAIMPYGFIEMCGDEAFTGPAEEEAPGAGHSEVPAFWARFTRKLDRDAEDLEGRLLLRGTRVLFSPHDPDAFLEDAASNRLKFEQRDYAWTGVARQRVWFPSWSTLDEDQKTVFERAHAFQRAFSTGMTRSLADLRGAPYPLFARAPASWVLRSRRPRIGPTDHQVADLTESLVKHEMQRAGAPEGISWSEEWRDALAKACSLRVFAIGAPGVVTWVVTICSPGAGFLAPGRIAFEGPDASTLDLARRVVANLMSSHPGPKPFCVFIMAMDDAHGDEVAAVANVDHAVVTTWRSPEGDWLITLPPLRVDAPEARRFLKRLTPRQERDTASEVAHYLRRHVGISGRGAVAARDVAAKFGLAISELEAIVFHLESDSQLGVFRARDGELIIAHRTLAVGERVTAASRRREATGRRITAHVPTFAVTSACATAFALGYIGGVPLVAVPIVAAIAFEWRHGRRLDRDAETERG